MRKNEAYKGHETWWNKVRMEMKMQLLGLKLALLTGLSLFILTGGLILHFTDDITTVKDYYCAKLVCKLTPNKTVSLTVGNHVYRNFKAAELISMRDLTIFVNKKSEDLKFNFILASIFCLIVGSAVYPATIYYFSNLSRKQSENKYIRGAKLTTVAELKKEMAKRKEDVDIPFGEIKLPVSAEVKHYFMCGRPGAGKTVLTSKMFDRLRCRQERGILYDFKGDYVSRFYNPESDILFNPLDRRCLGWSIFNDIKTVMDIDSVAHSLIPPAYSADPFWNDGARDVFSGILHYLYQKDKVHNKDIWNAVTSPGKSIAGWLKNTKGGERVLDISKMHHRNRRWVFFL